MKVRYLKYITFKILIGVVLGIAATPTADAQLIELNVSIRRDTIKIGERTEIIAGITKNKQVLLYPFSLKDSLNKEIEIIDSLSASAPDSISYKLLITSFTPGVYTIPQIPLVFSYENNIDTIYSSKLVLTVISPEIINEGEIKDIKPPLNLPFKLKEILPETGIILSLLLALFIMAFLIFRRLRKNSFIEKAEKELPAHVYAFRELDRLKQEKLWQNGKTKEYYSRLADIMRNYLEKRFSFPAMEFVSSETLEAFRNCMPQEEMLQEMLEGILQTSDMVKFAKAVPLPADNQGNLDNAYLLVGQTKIEEISSNDEKLELTEKE